MALCDPCYGLFRILEPDSPYKDECRQKESVPSATAFHDWLRGRLVDPGDEAFPQLPGLIHSSWKSFSKSLDNFCPVCWIVWRHIRASPMSLYHDEVHQRFYLCYNEGYGLTDTSGILNLKCSNEIQDWDTVLLSFKRATKQRFEEVVAKSPLEEHLGSETTVKTIKNWLSRCDRGHAWSGDGCVAKRRAVNNPVLPTRLIDVHSYGSQTWSLIETENHTKFPKYVALSHRWTTETPRLLRGNYSAFQTNQPDKTLPRSYQDVLVLCRSLDIQYVWIDSLCIFQDSADDFLHEAAIMKEVYANAFCTFSVCWESPYGFLRPRDQRQLARWAIAREGLSALSDRYVLVQDQMELRAAIDQTPVNRRGWVLQEQLLSPRVLYLGNDQLYWQCDTVTACETEPIFMDLGIGDYRRKNILERENRNHSTWRYLVAHFMTLGLTFERDRLLAISGIARFLLTPMEGTVPEGSSPESYQGNEKTLDQGVEYAAGLQRAHWIEDLLWYPRFRAITPKLIKDRFKIGPESFDRQPDNIVPSWSWAACPGPIDWETPTPDAGQLAYLRNIKFEPLGSDAYGLPKSASLEISCLLVQARYFCNGNPRRLYQTKDMCFYTETQGFLLPLPYPRTHSDGISRLAVLLEPSTKIMPTCFIMPLRCEKTKSGTISRITGLVVQEVTRGDSNAKMREFVRIGSFSKKYGFGADEVIRSLLKNVPTEGDEFEQNLRDSVRAWRIAYCPDACCIGWKGTAKAEWTTIRLV